MTRDIRTDAIARCAQGGVTITEPTFRSMPIEARRITKSNDGPKELVAIATTSAIDLDQEVVVAEGGDPALFQQLKTVYVNHDYFTPDGPFGKMRSVKLMRDAGQWLIRVAAASTAFAQNWLTLIEEEVVNGGSIGFERVDSGPLTEEEVEQYGPASLITRRWKWFEWSVTPMPCQPQALIQRGGAAFDDKGLGQLDNLVRKGVIPLDFARKVGLPPERVGKPRRILVV